MEVPMKLLIKNIRIWYFIFSCAIFNVYGNENPVYRIEIGFKKTQVDTAYLAHFYGNKLVLVDTSTFVNNSTIIFEGSKKLKKGLYVLKYGNQLFEFIVDGQQFSLQINTEDPSKTIVKNSAENTIYFYYNAFIDKSQNIKDSLLNIYINNRESLEFKSQMNTLAFNVAEFKKKILKM